jgi:HEAT repeat protein
MSVDKIAQNIIDAYASDPVALMRDGCRGYGLDNVRAAAVCEAIDKGGVVTEDEAYRLSYFGLGWKFIDQIAGFDGFAPIRARQLWLDEHGVTKSKYEYAGRIRKVAGIKTNSLSDADYVPEAYVRTHIEMLKDDDDAVRLEAAYQLGGIGAAAKDAIPALIDALRDEANDDVVGYLRYALVRMGAAAVPALRGVIENGDKSARLRKWTATMLGGIGHDNSDTKSAAIISLTKALEDEDRYVRETAAGQLGRLGCSAGMEAPKALVDALKDTDRYVRAAAAAALGKFDFKTEEVACELSSLLFNDYGNVKKAAASALINFGVEAKAVIPSLIAILEGDEDRPLQAMAISALGRIGRDSPDALSAISAALFIKLPDCMFDEIVEEQLNRPTPDSWCSSRESGFHESNNNGYIYSWWTLYALKALKHIGKQGCGTLLRAAKEHPHRVTRLISADYFNETCR